MLMPPPQRQLARTEASTRPRATRPERHQTNSVQPYPPPRLHLPHQVHEPLCPLTPREHTSPLGTCTGRKCSAPPRVGSRAGRAPILRRIIRTRAPGLPAQRTCSRAAPLVDMSFRVDFAHAKSPQTIFAATPSRTTPTTSLTWSRLSFSVISQAPTMAPRADPTAVNPRRP